MKGEAHSAGENQRISRKHLHQQLVPPVTTCRARAPAKTDRDRTLQPRARSWDLNIMPTLVVPGAIRSRRSSHFPASDSSKLLRPVIFRPGWAKLSTKPLPAGSETLQNTIGMVEVARMSASVGGVVVPIRTSGCIPTSSSTFRRHSSTSPPGRRISSTKSRSMTQPSAARPSSSRPFSGGPAGSPGRVELRVAISRSGRACADAAAGINASASQR